MGTLISRIQRSSPMDIAYVGLTCLLFALSLGLVRLCDRL
jgi:hypothetical protein